MPQPMPRLLSPRLLINSEELFNLCSDVRYVSKHRNTPDASGYDIAMLVYQYFYKFKFCTI